MANQSIRAAFERMWQHVVAALSNKSDISHVHDDIYYKTEMDEMLEGLGDTSKNTWYGACSTSGTTRTVTTDTGDFSLTAGNTIYVLFTYAASASTTLNVDGTGAKNIKSVGTTNVTANQWGANEVVALVYDGTYFRMVDGMTATTTYYGMTKLSSSTSSTATNLAATPSAVKSAYDLANAALPKAGGTMTGALTLSGEPTSNLHAATKQYVDNKVSGSSSGGGNYDKHVWVKTGYPIPSYTTTWSTVTGKTLGMVGTAVTSSLSISDSYEVSEDGSTCSLVNPRTFSWTNYGSSTYGQVTDSAGAITTFPALFTYLESQKTRPYYFIGTDSQTSSIKRCIKVTSATTFSSTTSQPYSLSIGTSYEQSSVNTTWDTSKVGTNEMFFTTSASSYTEGLDGNGYTYSYLGVPSDKTLSLFPQSGSYVGTGTGLTYYSGILTNDMINSASAVSLTLDYLPKSVSVAGRLSFTISKLSTTNFSTVGVSCNNSSNNNVNVYACIRGTTLYWKGFTTSQGTSDDIGNQYGVSYAWSAEGNAKEV